MNDGFTKKKATARPLIVPIASPVLKPKNLMVVCIHQLAACIAKKPNAIVGTVTLKNQLAPDPRIGSVLPEWCHSDS
ncbi:hypothetical protein DEM27_10345 [Metarhizobium album]|uniref:Uncharacterized protein n=1 Tax=Metarhizobium album TaxID=2182425 RepID=A0A2U2DTW8_9HYPH|nr:hypothetical protein [Rhizobium album]PWE56753.1 hypothetical protein DEM27_10345 [Rhizobium album]